MLLTFVFLLLDNYNQWPIAIYKHRLTYSHSWGRTHKCIVQIRIRMLLKVFVFCFFFTKSSPPPPSCITPTSLAPLYLVLNLKIRVLIENAKFNRNLNFDHIFSSRPASSLAFASSTMGVVIFSACKLRVYFSKTN